MTEFTTSITYEPGDPLYTGTGEAAGEVIDYSLPVSVAGRGFLIDRSGQFARHTRRSLDLLNTQQSTSGDDLSAIPPEVWRRTFESWHQGAGQSRADRQGSLPYRYFDSYNVDVWDEWRLKLLPDTELLQSIGVGTPFLTTVGPNRFVAVVGTTSYWWNSIDLAPATFTMPAPVLDVCSDGANLYTVEADGKIRRYNAPATGTVIGTVPNHDPTRAMLAYVKGFIVAAGGQYLYDMTTGSPTLVFQHPLSDFRWVDACEGLSPAYLLGGIGDKWQVYGMTIKSDATTFDPPVALAPVPEGEIAYALGSYLGYILIGTNAGWRFGIPSSDGTLTFGKLVETSAPVRCFEGQDRFVWYGQSASGEAFAGLGRADLSQFVAPMTPAYASDLRTTSSGDVTGVITFGAGADNAGRRVFIVSGVGVFCESTELAADGWLEQGGLTFNSADPKMGLYLQVVTEPLPVGSSFTMQVRYDSSGWQEVASQNTPGSTQMGNVTLHQSFNLASIRYTLSRSETNTDQGPTVQRMEFRAINVPGLATEFQLPLMLRSDMYSDGGPMLRDPADDYGFLIDLWRTRQPFTYREAGLTFTVHATDFTFIPEQLSENGSAYEGLFVLTAKEIR